MSCGHVREGSGFGHRVTLSDLSAGPPSLPREGTLGEELFTDSACVLGCRHRVAHRPRVCEDLVVVSTLQRHEADAAVAAAAAAAPEPGAAREMRTLPFCWQGGFLGYLVPLETKRHLSLRKGLSPSPELQFSWEHIIMLMKELTI